MKKAYEWLIPEFLHAANANVVERFGGMHGGPEFVRLEAFAQDG